MPVPLHDGRYDSEPAIRPGDAATDARERGNPRPETPDAVVLCYNPDLLEHLVGTHAGEELPGQYFGGTCYRLRGADPGDATTGGGRSVSVGGRGCSPRTAPADDAVRGALRTACESAGIPTREGPTWTTDAIFRETVAEVRAYAAEGVLTVEMEAATVFTVARCRDARAGAVFVPSDYVTTDGWAPRFGDDVGEAGVRSVTEPVASYLGDKQF